jgi:hypothetical protein
VDPEAQPGIDPESFPLLEDEQINMIRVYEVDLQQGRRAGVIVPPDVVEELLTQYSQEPSVPKGRGDQRRFRRRPDYEQLRLIFEVRATPLYGEVQVRNDPPALMRFRRLIHRQYVLNYCGSTRCHGGRQAGEFLLYPRRPASTNTVYTNFYILDAYEQGRWRMIDRSKPEESLLLQYGLPRDAALTPHPDVPGWGPQFIRSPQRNPTYRNVLQFIEELYEPKPNYGLQYSIPKGKPLPKPEETEEGAESPEQADQPYQR